jgi:uncharacterized protein YjiS (DUF1127 family)
MSESDELHFLSFEQRRLTPEKIDCLHQQVARRANDARTQALRGLFDSIASLLRRGARRLAAAAGKGWNAYAAWLAQRAAARELHGLDDRSLKDLGIHRSQIEAVIHGSHSRRVNEGKVAAYLFHKPYQRPPGVMRQAARDAAAQATRPRAA